MYITTKETTLTVEHLLKLHKRRTGFSITRQDFMKLWRLFCNQFTEELLAGNNVILGPIGSFYVGEIIPKKKNKNVYAKDWQSTWDMWKEHPELRGKQFVYYVDGYKYPLYQVVWSKQRLPNFNSKLFIKYKAPHKVRKALFDAVKGGKEYL